MELIEITTRKGVIRPADNQTLKECYDCVELWQIEPCRIVERWTLNQIIAKTYRTYNLEAKSGGEQPL